MEFFVIYLLVSIEKIAALLISAEGIAWLVIVPSAVILFMLGFIALLSAELGEFVEGFKKYYPLKTAIFVVALAVFLSSVGKVLPSQKELAIIVGSGVVYNAVTSEAGQRIGNKAVQLLEKKVDEILSDEKPKVGEDSQKSVNSSST